MATALQTPATDKQVSFLRKLASERGGDTLGQNRAERVESMEALLAQGMSKQGASKWITHLLKQPITPAPSANVQRGGFGIPQQRSNVAQPKEVAAELTPGVYDVDGHVYVVKFNKTKTRLYANRLVETATDRLNAEGDMVQIEFVYEAGAIFNIKSTHKMSYDDAKMLTIRYGRCIVCNRRLKAGKSVEQGIGPVCRKSFA